MICLTTGVLWSSSLIKSGCIERIVKNHKEPTTFEDYSSLVFCPVLRSPGSEPPTPLLSAAERYPMLRTQTAPSSSFSTNEKASVRVLRYVHSMQESFSLRQKKLPGTEWTLTAQNWNKSLRRLKYCTRAVGQEDLVWCTKSQSSLANIYFHLSGVQSSLPLIRLI